MITKKEDETFKTRLKSAIDKLKSAGSYEDEKIQFVVGKNSDRIENWELNMAFLEVANLKAESLIKWRNYFYQKALGA